MDGLIGMGGLFNPYEELNDKGLAVGWEDIRNDAMVFRFHDELLSFPTIAAHPLAQYNGYFYTVPIEKLRELKQKT